MRTKPLWIFVGVTVVGGILAFAFFAAGPEKKSPTAQSLQRTSNPKSQPAPKAPASRPFSGPKPPLPPDQQDKAIAQGELISSLYEAGSSGDPAQTESVYAALSHPDAEVRSAALDVIVQFIGKGGIPKLQTALAATTSPTEKAQIAEAIEFLELPSFREIHGREATLQLLKGSGPRPKKPQVERRSEIPRR